MELSLNDLLSIGLVGVVLSFLIDWIKTRYGMESLATKGLTILLSLAIGAAFYFFKETPFYTAAIGVLSAATIVWAFFIKGSTVRN